MRKLVNFAKTLMPIAFWVMIMFGFETVSITFMTLLAAIIHEFGHIAVISVFCKDEPLLPIPRIDGMRITPSRILSYKEEIFSAFGGPCANLVLFLLLLPFFKNPNGYAVTFASINLMTALSNLLPVCGFDGYKILLNSVSLKFGCERAEIILCAFSFITSSVLLFLSLYLILKTGEGYWLFGIFFTSTLTEVFKYNNLTKSKNMRDFERY